MDNSTEQTASALKDDFCLHLTRPGGTTRHPRGGTPRLFLENSCSNAANSRVSHGHVRTTDGFFHVTPTRGQTVHVTATHHHWPSNATASHVDRLLVPHGHLFNVSTPPPRVPHRHRLLNQDCESVAHGQWPTCFSASLSLPRDVPDLQSKSELSNKEPPRIRGCWCHQCTGVQLRDVLCPHSASATTRVPLLEPSASNYLHDPSRDIEASLISNGVPKQAMCVLPSRANHSVSVLFDKTTSFTLHQTRRAPR